MSNLENTVNNIIISFIGNETLFTALDVSNKVKELVPSAKHREVRTLVRKAWNDSIKSSGYTRTPITVTLSNGDTAQALLYHPLSDSWDLDNKYNDQKRAQTAIKPVLDSVATPITVGTSTVSVADDGAITVTEDKTALVSDTISTSVVAKPMREVWQKMFDSQFSLFPRK